jgi:hypothetical protein
MFLFKDDIKLGLVLGLLAPFSGMFGFYYWKFHIYSVMVFIRYLGVEKHLITNMLSFSLLANAILFTVYVNSNKDKTATGIFVVTCLYAIGALILKFIY